MEQFDFHTHRLDTPPGAGIVCLPQEVLLSPETFKPQEGGLYAVGIHPWWTAQPDFDLEHHLQALEEWLQMPEIVQLGECGIDRMRGADIETQQRIFEAQIALSERYKKPMTIHCVRAFDVLLAIRKRLRPTQQWTVHGFRGNPTLAKQLLEAGFNLSFGPKRNEESYRITPPDRRYEESDAE